MFLARFGAATDLPEGPRPPNGETGPVRRMGAIWDESRTGGKASFGGRGFIGCCAGSMASRLGPCPPRIDRQGIRAEQDSARSRRLGEGAPFGCEDPPTAQRSSAAYVRPALLPDWCCPPPIQSSIKERAQETRND